MSLNRTPDYVLPFHAPKLQYAGHEISWAGECPWTGGLCFGTEEGKLLIPATDGTGRLDVHELVQSGEVINGMAFAGDRLLAASTRGEIVFYERPKPGAPLVSIYPAFEGGAHGVVATSAGGFVAPLDYFGLLFMDVHSDRTASIRIAKPSEGDKKFYKLVRLGTSEHGDLFACALRKGGVVSMVISKTGETVSS